MATTTLRHPNHVNPLVPLDFSNESITKSCELCSRKISAEAYTCHEGFKFYYHRVCAEAPPEIERHPLHPAHPLPLIHHRRSFICDCCSESFKFPNSSFRCNECDFEMDICCALSTLPDQGGSQGGKTSEQITVPLHTHPLTSFSKRHGFVRDSDCNICRGSVKGDGYMCLRRSCAFIIHKGCIQDPYYADGIKAPRVYHGHTLETFVGDDAGSRTCSSCGSDKSGEFIGCASCEVFYHRHCIQVECAFQVLSYCEEGMSAKIKLSWHKHQLLLCHQTKSVSDDCFYSGDESTGPMYACKVEDCQFLLHKRCTEIESTIVHPHHPDHPLTLCERDDGSLGFCIACCETIYGLKFSCKLCLVDLHVKCAARFPTHKHYLHEHNLLRFEELRDMRCNRCSTSTDSSFESVLTPLSTLST